MAIAFRLNVTGADQTRRYFQRIGRTIPRRAIPDALVEIGLRVQRQAATKEIAGGGLQFVGARPAPALKDRLTSRTGSLRRSIRVNRSGLPRHVDVGSDLVYARVHELGGRAGRGGSVNLPPRPYLTPALEKINKDGTVRKVMNKHLSREIEGSPV